MPYEYITDGREVTLEIVAGADNSLSGLELGNSRFILVPVEDIKNISVSLYGEYYLAQLERTLFNCGISIAHGQELLVIERYDRGLGYPLHSDTYDLLRLYKSSAVFFAEQVSYKIVNGQMKPTGWGTVLPSYYYNRNDDTHYHLSEVEKTNFLPWCKIYGDLGTASISPMFNELLNSYQKSFNIAFVDQAYITLFTILEMIFGSGSGEITYKISRGIALLLSSNTEQMKEIYKQITRLYTIRSKYVHSGKRVNRESLLELREITRRTILTIMDLGYHKPDKTLSDLREYIDFSGRILIPPTQQ